MAILDRQRNVVVLRIVYDGPAAAGKTTSVRALAASLSREAVTPEQAGERTLYFDWLDYTGGLFEGYQLRCQIVSVPGQAMLARRRNLLLAEADAVIHVAEVSGRTFDQTMAALSTLEATLSLSAREPVGIVLQANKRDLPDAVPAAALRSALEVAGLKVGVVESVATAGSGIREAFVFGVRLALDRVREQIRSGTLQAGSPEIDSADQLYERMRATEMVRASTDAHRGPTLTPMPAESALLEVLAGETTHTPSSSLPPPIERSIEPADLEDEPRAPDETVPSGLIWPPVEGRLALRESTTEPLRLRRVDSGWSASTASGWRVHTANEHVFHDVEEGRSSLVRWARWHASHAAHLSPRRCVVLAQDGAAGWRLWQIVRSHASLTELLASALDESDVDKLATTLVDASLRLVELSERVPRQAGPGLPLSLDTVGACGHETLFVGLMPGAPDPAEKPRTLEDHMREVVSDWAHRRNEIAHAVRTSRTHTRGEQERRVVDRVLRLFQE